MTRYNLVSPRPRKDGKTHWHNVGSAFTRDKGGFSLIFDSLPLPDSEGRVSLLMTEPLERDRQERREEPKSGGGRGFSSELDDEIPFSPEWR